MTNIFTKNDLPDLKKAYNKAIKAGEKEFTFKEQILIVDYAKYLIEYLEGFKYSPNTQKFS